MPLDCRLQSQIFVWISERVLGVKVLFKEVVDDEVTHAGVGAGPGVLHGSCAVRRLLQSLLLLQLIEDPLSDVGLWRL